MTVNERLFSDGDRSKIPQIALPVFAAFAVNYFGYVYFFDFDQGVGSAPFIIKAAKDIAYAALVATFVFLPLGKPTTPRQWLFIPFAVVVSAASLVHARQTGIAAQLWENGKNTLIFVAVYWAMFLLSQSQRTEFTKRLFIIILASALVQLLFSCGITAAGHSLWLDDLYVGFMANPNSFALLLNLVAAICLTGLVYCTDLKMTVAALAAIGLATFGVIEAASSSQFVILIFLACYSIALSLWARRAAALRLGAALLVVTVISTSFGQNTVDAVIVPLSDIVTNSLGLKPIETTKHLKAMTAGDRELSVSVTYRREMIKHALSVLSKGPESALLGDLETHEYLKMDGQFLVFLANDGLLSVLAFGLAALFVYIASLRMIPAGSPLIFGLHLMIVAFGITLLASRVLQYFPLNWLFFVISGLLMAETSSASGSVRMPRGFIADGGQERLAPVESLRRGLFYAVGPERHKR